MLYGGTASKQLTTAYECFATWKIADLVLYGVIVCK